MRRLLLILPLALLGFASAAQAWDVEPFTANYKFNINSNLGSLNGSATRKLEKTGTNTYHYVFSASAAIATATETSDFSYDGKNVTSYNYQQQSKIAWFTKLVTIGFDWKNNIATGTRDSKKAQYVLKPGTLDGLNMEIQIRGDIMAQGKPGTYWLASPKDMSELEFENVGEEVLDTPLGKLQTVKYKRKNQGDRITMFWLAKDMNYMPAKVQQTDDGNVYTVEITSYQPQK